METHQSKAYYGMIGVSLVFAVLAIVTVMPNPAASKPNVLGYRSICSFAPAATALCGLLAGISCTVRNRLVSRRAASTRYQPFTAPIATAIILIAIVAVSGIRFREIQSGFGSVITKTALKGAAFKSLSDGIRSATVSEGDITATVELTLVAGRIENLRLTSAENIGPSLATTIFDEVITAQSSKVDAVAGATASSKILLKAIEAAAAISP